MKYFSPLLFLLISFSSSFVGATACENIFSGLKKETPLYEGIQEAQKMIQLGKKLQAEQADAYTTHIPEFAQQINKHYKHFERIIEETHLNIQEKKPFSELKKDHNQKIINKRRAALTSLRAEALQYAQNQNLTYAYWLRWNERGALVSSVQSPRVLEDLNNESVFYTGTEQIQNILSKIKDNNLENFQNLELLNHLIKQIQNTLSKIKDDNRKKIQNLELLNQLIEQIQVTLPKVKNDNGKKFQNLELLNHLIKQIQVTLPKVKNDNGKKFQNLELLNHLIKQIQVTLFTRHHEGERFNNMYRQGKSFLMSIENFPHLIALPTTEKMGIVAFNQFESGIVPLGLGGMGTFADGYKIDPYLFIIHDINHHHIEKFGYPSSMTDKWTDPNISKEEFQKKFFKIINEYPLEKKEQAEIAFFLQEHENNFLVKDMESLVQEFTKDVLSDRNYKRFMIKEDLGQYLPSHIDLNSAQPVKNYLSELVETYKQTVHQIEQNLSMNNNLFRKLASLIDRES